MRKRPKRVFWDGIPNSRVISHVLDVFLAPCGRMELISFAMSKASCDTSLEYPQHIIPITSDNFENSLLLSLGPFSTQMRGIQNSSDWLKTFFLS